MAALVAALPGGVRTRRLSAEPVARSAQRQRLHGGEVDQCAWRGGTVERRCVAPSDRPPFFPTINVAGVFEIRGAFLNPVTRTQGVTPIRVWGIWARDSQLAPDNHTGRRRGTDGHRLNVCLRVA